VIFEGSVYDVSEYKDNHPGGGSLFNDWFGKAIDDPFEEEGHSKAARLVFRDLPLVGFLAGSKKDGTSRQPTGLGGS
jgi:cytochrome b involved in lipid metabolism